jgi:dCMP deaminase
MENAKTWARRSKAIRKKTGAIIVLNNQTISDGYNGMPANALDDRCELHDPLHDTAILNANGEMITNPLVLHAESNALLKLVANGGRGTQGATLYCTLSPCVECTKLILQAKIARVVFDEAYRVLDGIDILRSYGVQVQQLINGCLYE